MSTIFITREWPGADSADSKFGSHKVRTWPKYEVPPHAALCEAVRDVDAIITTIEDPIDAAVLDAAGDSLKIVAQAGVGFDNIDLDAARSRGVWVTNAPGVLNECTADLAFALMMAVARRIPEAVDYVKAGKWSGWHPSLLVGAEFHGATVGIVGLGRIGMAFSRRCEGFDMKILYNSRSPKAEAEARGYSYRSLDDLLAECDFVSLHAPLSTATRGLIGAEKFEIMKPTAILVNTARGALVDTTALLAALSNGQIAGAGLDVTDPEPLPHNHPLLDLSNVVVLPHIGSAGTATRRKMFELAAANVASVLEGSDPNQIVVNPND